MTDIEFEENEQENIITLVDEDGVETDFYHVGTIDYKGKYYCLFQIADPQSEEEEEEVAIYELCGEEPDQTLEPIDDDDLLDEIFEEFCNRYEEYDDEE